MPTWYDHVACLGYDNLSLALMHIDRTYCRTCSHIRCYAYDILIVGSHFIWRQFSIIVCLIVEIAMIVSTCRTMLSLQ